MADSIMLLPGSGDLSEFQGYSGDCGEDAELMAAHVVTGLPLDGAELNAIVRRDIAHGWASANGAEPLSSIADDLTLAGVKYTEYPYPGPPQAEWVQVLQDNAGKQPVIFEFANGQNLSGDEPGLHYHFATCLGKNQTTGNFLFGDGDNARTHGTVLAEYTLSMVEGAQPCGMIVVKYPQKDASGYEIQSDGSIIYNASGIHLMYAMAAYVRDHQLTNEALCKETYYDDTHSFVPFSNGLILQWDKVRGSVVETMGGEVLVAVAREGQKLL